jgi:protein tyrosine phosphatase type 4A
LPFDDGTAPPPEVVDQFFELVRTRFKADPDCCIAVHCVAGLGRAPVLVALALMEVGMKYEDAVELIRKYVFYLIMTIILGAKRYFCF